MTTERAVALAREAGIAAPAPLRCWPLELAPARLKPQLQQHLDRLEKDR